MKHVCPWWMTYTFDNPIRKLIHNQKRILADYVKPGMRVADIGCGMGYFTIALARMAGPSGQVQAIDLQEKQLGKVMKRAAQAGVSNIEPVQASPQSIGLSGAYDFALAFWMLHEVPDKEGFLRQIHASLKPGAVLLMSEPIFHVWKQTFRAEVAAARMVGFEVAGYPAHIRGSRTVLLRRKA